MDDASSDLMRLRPVTFRYKKDYDSAEGRLRYGLVAEVYPVVVADATGQAQTVEYLKLPAMLVNELQKQHRKLQQQEAVIADLAERLARLEQAPTVPKSPVSRTASPKLEVRSRVGPACVGSLPSGAWEHRDTLSVIQEARWQR